MIHRTHIWLFALAVVVLSPLAQLSACVGCRQAGADVAEAEPETIMAGFALSWSVLFMLAVVFGVLTFLGFYVARTVARVDHEHSNTL